MSIKKILVTGANGQLGWELTQLAASYPMYEFIFADRSMFDLSKLELSGVSPQIKYKSHLSI